MSHQKFSSLRAFENAKAAMLHNHRDSYDVMYRAKPKLHGANVAIRIEHDGSVYFQKRTTDITPKDDLFGFAKFASEEYLNIVEDNVFDYVKSFDTTVTIYGEWAGRGTVKNAIDAVCTIEQKQFFIFDVAIGEGDTAHYIKCPMNIKKFAKDTLDNVHIVPWVSEPMHVNMASNESVEKFINEVNEMTEKMAERDFYIADVFGIEGKGEGFVFYPQISEVLLTKETFSRFGFKAKAEHHRVNKSSNPAKKGIEIPEDVQAFIDMFVTEARINQSVNEVVPADRDVTAQDTGQIISWAIKDILKESEAEIAGANFEWKDVQKLIGKAVSTKVREVLFS